MANGRDEVLAAIAAEAASLALTVDGGSVTVPLTARRFSTGSAGYHWQGKVDGQDGRRYQVNITATLIGSKPGA